MKVKFVFLFIVVLAAISYVATATEKDNFVGCCRQYKDIETITKKCITASMGLTPEIIAKIPGEYANCLQYAPDKALDKTNDYCTCIGERIFPS